jgi:hypothetical protein
MAAIKCCKDCTKRHAKCHSECEEYKADKARYEEEKKKYRIANQAEYFLRDTLAKPYQSKGKLERYIKHLGGK